MKVRDVLEILAKVNPDADIYVAGHMETEELANTILMADDKNSDGELKFCDFGLSMGDIAVLITFEDNT